jgi:hypothetical protein
MHDIALINTLSITREVKQKFLDEDGNSTWYLGTIIDYSPQEKTHCFT